VGELSVLYAEDPGLVNETSRGLDTPKPASNARQKRSQQYTREKQGKQDMREVPSMTMIYRPKRKTHPYGNTAVFNTRRK
jgi:hypothetical protein